MAPTPCAQLPSWAVPADGAIAARAIPPQEHAMSNDNRYGNNSYPHNTGIGRTRYGNHKAETVIAPAGKARDEAPAANDIADAATQATIVDDEATTDAATAAPTVGALAPPRLVGAIPSGFTRTEPRTRDAGSGEAGIVDPATGLPANAADNRGPISDMPIGWGVIAPRDPAPRAKRR
jgi:hypothetical protein